MDNQTRSLQSLEMRKIQQKQWESRVNAAERDGLNIERTDGVDKVTGILDKQNEIAERREIKEAALEVWEQ